MKRALLHIIHCIFLILTYVTVVDAEPFYVKNGQIYLGEQKVKLIGANIAFWNKRWERVTKEDLLRDIKQIKQLGNCARIFVPYGEESKGHFGTLNARTELLDKLEYFVNESEKRGVAVMVSFLFLEYNEIEKHQKFILQIINKLKAYNNVIYDMQNEPDIEARYLPERRPLIASWCNQITKFVKQNDPGQHLVTIGFSGLDMILTKEIDLNNMDVICFHFGEDMPYVFKRRILKLTNFLKEQGYLEKPIAIGELALSSKDFDENKRAGLFKKYADIADSFDVPIFLWWVLRDIPKDPYAIDGDDILVEPHRFGIFEANGSAKKESTKVAIKFGKEATRLNFKNKDGGRND